MSKITVENKKGKFIIVNKLSYPEAINERVYNAIISGTFAGFMNLDILEKRKETKIECVVQGLIPLNQYFGGMVTKDMFLDFVHKLALHIKNCDKNMINANNLDLQADRIFIDPKNKSVKCIFWPVVNNQNDKPPHLFLKQLPYTLRFNPHEDNSYLNTYNSFFSGVTPFSVNNFDRMILKLWGKNTGGVSAPSESLAGSSKNINKAVYSDVNSNQKANIEYDPFAIPPVNIPPANISQPKTEPPAKQEGFGNFCSSCGAKNEPDSKFCFQCGNKLITATAPSTSTIPEPPVFEPPVNGTVVLGDDDGGTTVLGYDEPEVIVYPTLTRLKTEEVSTIDKPSFRIGTEQQYCDLFIRDNTYVSRSHADIITREDRYYIVDKNSTNKTYVDGKVIPIETEVEIFSGTQIRLANEDFVFNIES